MHRILLAFVSATGVTSGVAAQEATVPPGAAALGYTKCIIDERPTAGDIAPGRGGDHKWFSGQWWAGEGPSLDHYRTQDANLVLSLGGDLVSTPRDFTGGKLPLLPGPDGFYVEFEVRLSDNDADHWPAVWLMPAEHGPKQEDHYEGDPAGYERFMELDIDEGGFGPGLTGTVHSTCGVWSKDHGYPEHIQNPNNVSTTPLDRSQWHTLGGSYDPTQQRVTWWVDGVEQMSAGAPYVPEVAAKQHFYLIISNQTHGAEKPYDMFVRAVRAYVPPGASLPVAPETAAAASPLSPLPDAPGAPGLAVRYYEGDFGTVLDLPDAHPVKETTAEALEIPDYTQADEFGLEFYGALAVPRDGDYTFYTTSDDGSRLYLGTRLVVQNDYPHGTTEKPGSVTLTAGRYPIYVGYFEGVVDQVLQVSWEGPGIPKGAIPAEALSQHPQVVTFPRDAVTKTELDWPDLGQRLTVTVDTRDTPDLQALHETIPAVLLKHYPTMLSILWAEADPLPSEVRFQARPGIDNPAYASGNRIVLSAEWFARNPDDLGCLVHEMSHLVQRYPDFAAKPGWLVEGIADYVRYRVKADDRWTIPESYREGTSYENGYGVTAAFLVYLERHYGDDLVAKLNRALKNATYADALFQDLTGKPLDDLWEEYKQKSAEDAKAAA